MLEWIFFGLAMTFGATHGNNDVASGSDRVVIGEGVVIGGDVVIEGATGEASDTVVGFVAEPQVPSGKFTTATEVKPILEMTTGNWVAIRDYDGQDLLYVTHIWSWRCGLLRMRYALNDEPLQDLPLPPCHEETGAPNAIIDSDGLPYLSFAQGSISSVRVELLLDDLSTLEASFSRSDILMP